MHLNKKVQATGNREDAAKNGCEIDSSAADIVSSYDFLSFKSAAKGLWTSDSGSRYFLLSSSC
jgi:hypothetical protein